MSEVNIQNEVPVDNDAGAKDTPAEKIDIPVDGVNAQNEVSDNEAVRASSGKIDGSFFEKCDKVEHITNDRNEVSRDDKIADISIGVGVEGGVVDEMSSIR
ncbi:uncharacterized protein LOC141705946 [Apium graveolens]|uniref:uncharacterized protein LOC141705946 n=1 Tax=Apium graveolens TaxID=4045 RepID=UPI003D7C0990